MAKLKPAMPDEVVLSGGRVVPVMEQPPGPVDPGRDAPGDRPVDRPHPLPSAGKPAADPAGGNASPSGGGKPTMAMELARALPMQPGQRGRDQKETESGSAYVAKALAAQLASAPEFLNRQQIDERKMAVLQPETQTPYNYLAFRGYVDGVRFWAWFVDAELVTSQAIEGLARRHALRAIEGSSGATVTEPQKKPGILSRNLWNRDWKEKSIRAGSTVEDEE